MRHDATECVGMAKRISLHVQVDAALKSRIEAVAAARLGGVKASQIVREILEQSAIDGLLAQVQPSKLRQGSPPINPTVIPRGRSATG